MSKFGYSVVPRGLLDTKGDIPFPAAQVTIYQPSFKEIAMLGKESDFFIGVKALIKNYKTFEDNSDLSQFSNFQILMTMIAQNNTQDVKLIKNDILQVLSLIFPFYKVFFTPRSIVLQEIEGDKQSHVIDENNFDDFALILNDMFCMIHFQGEKNGDYDPLGDRARAIVEMIKKGHQKVAELRQERGDEEALLSVLGRYLNILAVGEHKDKNVLANYSVYQLVEEFKRFQLKETFDFTFQAKMAGATKIKDAKDWMGDIQFKDED